MQNINARLFGHLYDFDPETIKEVMEECKELEGDSDKLACIAEGIAEAFFGVPAVLKSECKSTLPMIWLL